MQSITKALAVVGVSGDAVVRTPTPQIAEHAAELLTRLFRGLESAVPLRLWNGRVLKLGNAGKRMLSAKSERFTLVFRSPAAVSEMAFGRDPLRIAEVYFRDDMDIEGDFFAALGLKDHLRAIRMSWRDRFGALAAALRLLLADRTAQPTTTVRASLHGASVKEHSKTENRDAIAFHYDLSNHFYALWLDEGMVYSCAYFQRPDDTLDRAQQAKLDHVCRKLMLKPGETMLDIGFGWGRW